MQGAAESRNVPAPFGVSTPCQVAGESASRGPRSPRGGGGAKAGREHTFRWGAAPSHCSPGGYRL